MKNVFFKALNSINKDILDLKELYNVEKLTISIPKTSPDEVQKLDENWIKSDTCTMVMIHLKQLTKTLKECGFPSKKEYSKNFGTNHSEEKISENSKMQSDEKNSENSKMKEKVEDECNEENFEFQSKSEEFWAENELIFEKNCKVGNCEEEEIEEEECKVDYSGETSEHFLYNFGNIEI